MQKWNKKPEKIHWDWFFDSFLAHMLNTADTELIYYLTMVSPLLGRQVAYFHLHILQTLWGENSVRSLINICLTGFTQQDKSEHGRDTSNAEINNRQENIRASQMVKSDAENCMDKNTQYMKEMRWSKQLLKTYNKLLFRENSYFPAQDIKEYKNKCDLFHGSPNLVAKV